MRPVHILLIALFIVFVLALTFAPRLLQQWRAADDALPVPAEPAPITPLPEEDDGNAPQLLSPAAELERVTGILMLHNACVNRFDGFDRKSRDTLEAWKERHAQTLAKRGAEPDFYIVLADPEAPADTKPAQDDAEQRALCERNLDAMRTDLEAAR